MRRISTIACLVTVLICGCATAVAQVQHADTNSTVTPPMGWNSYDAYGTTVNEAQVRAAASAIAQELKPFGWKYVVIDMEWFVLNPTPAGNSKTSQYTMDEFGRYAPAPNRFPSAAGGAGFKPLADYIHSLGLKFGVHMLRGIPRQAVERDLPIAGSGYHASEAADQGNRCPWNPDNYGVRADAPASQAYYDSVATLYAEWGVDLVKVDCIASHPYSGADIRMLSTALKKANRAIVLSLSPGPAPREKIEELREYSDMWRISDDVWDLWHSDVAYPQGVVDQFPRAAQWAALSGGGHWADADMLPLGSLRPAPGWGPPRETRLSHDEQRTLMTLWCIFRSPLMFGGNPEDLDPWTLSLLTNPEVLEVDQHSTSSAVVFEGKELVAWKATRPSIRDTYLAVFNLSQSPKEFSAAWKDLSLPARKYSVRDLWDRKDLGKQSALHITVPPHSCVLYRLR